MTDVDALCYAQEKLQHHYNVNDKVLIQFPCLYVELEVYSHLGAFFLSSAPTHPSGLLKSY
jgi:hypothetical protein